MLFHLLRCVVCFLLALGAQVFCDYCITCKRSSDRQGHELDRLQRNKLKRLQNDPPSTIRAFDLRFLALGFLFLVIFLMCALRFSFYLISIFFSSLHVSEKKKLEPDWTLHTYTRLFVHNMIADDVCSLPPVSTNHIFWYTHMRLYKSNPPLHSPGVAVHWHPWSFCSILTLMTTEWPLERGKIN